jgi:Flp pilus assembly protein TadB
LDLLIVLVIAAFIITAVFVGYYASQKPQEKTTGIPEESIELEDLDKQTIQILHIKADQSKSIG